MKTPPLLFTLVFLTGCGWTPNRSRTEAQASQLLAAFSIYRAEFGAIPDLAPDSVLGAMHRGNPKRFVIYSPTDEELKARAFLDAWSRPFRYTDAAGKVSVKSSGEDGVFGTADDISESEK